MSSLLATEENVRSDNILYRNQSLDSRVKILCSDLPLDAPQIP